MQDERIEQMQGGFVKETVAEVFRIFAAVGLSLNYVPQPRDPVNDVASLVNNGGVVANCGAMRGGIVLVPADARAFVLLNPLAPNFGEARAVLRHSLTIVEVCAACPRC